MLGSKVRLFAGLNVDDTDNTLLGNERHGEFGADQRVGVDVARFFADIVDQNGTASFNCHSSDAVTHLDLQALRLGCVPNLEPDSQFLCALVQQQNGKNLIIDDLTNELSHAPQQLISFQRAVERVCNINQEILQT